jgi:hypothetical protein
METNISTNVNFPVSIFKRLDQPLFAAFVTSYVIWNWKFFYILLTTFVPADNRIQTAIDNLSTHTINGNSLNHIEGPILVTIILILVAPIFNIVVLKVQLFYQKLEAIIKQEEKTNLARKIFEEEEKEAQYLRTIVSTETNIKSLKSKLIELRRDDVTDKDSEFTYNLLREKEKHQLARAIYSLQAALVYQKQEHRKSGFVQILQKNTDDTIGLTTLAKTILEKYNKEFPGALENK